MGRGEIELVEHPLLDFRSQFRSDDAIGAGRRKLKVVSFRLLTKCGV
jgi:hypothetical protein